MIQLWIGKSNDSGEKKISKSLTFLQVSFARYAFCISIAKCIWLWAKSPKTPDIYIGVSLFDTLLEKVRHFLTHLSDRKILLLDIRIIEFYN